MISEQQHRLTGFAPQQKAAKGDHPISASIAPTQSFRVKAYTRRSTHTSSHSTHQHIGVGVIIMGLGRLPENRPSRQQRRHSAHPGWPDDCSDQRRWWQERRRLAGTARPPRPVAEKTTTRSFRTASLRVVASLNSPHQAPTVGIEDLQYGRLSTGGWPMHQITQQLLLPGIVGVLVERQVGATGEQP